MAGARVVEALRGGREPLHAFRVQLPHRVRAVRAHQPDLAMAGGVTGALRIASMPSAWG